ncbi:hypothetical protein BP6252_09555 [Coleophoma cylindrospora]|uniref:Cytochrome P450 monooxygenase ABA1 n=1 Tax=Coleophoma cylindrospora TaxID=1849047 RepID=A0A3D8R2A1_9HELO|nr:hypothetical protein BP6252_09555 [Coleophoma cylindrospora]
MAFLSARVQGVLDHWQALVYVVLVFFAICWLAQALRAWFRLRHVHGPFSASFSNFWLIRHVSAGVMHLDLAEVCEKYGSLARIGPDTLVTRDPEIWKRMLAVRTPYKRSDWYDAMRLDPSRDNVLSEKNDDKHTELRAKMAAGYSGKENENLEETIDRNVSAFVQLINTEYISSSSAFKPLDFGRKSQYFTLDVISDVAFGNAFGFLETDSDVHEYIKTTEENLPAIIMVSVLPWLNWALQSPILKSLLPSDKDQLGLGKIMGIAKQVVGERFGPNKKSQRDMLGSFIRHGLTQKEAESETLVQILAGSDTTATAIRATMLYIITNPRVYTNLLEEIDSVPLSSPIQDSEARKLRYLQAVIKEGLRIFPPVTGLMTKVVPPGGDTINSLFIPEGTKIGYCAWGMFRNKKIWGEDADVFYPERWLEGPIEKIQAQEATLELIFGYGRWQCLGKSVAMIELNKIFVELLRHFNFAIIDPTDPWHSVNVGIFMQSEMWVRVSRRGSLQESSHQTSRLASS